MVTLCILACVPPPDGPCSIGSGCWITMRLVTLGAPHLFRIGSSTRELSVMLFSPIISTLPSIRWNPNFRPRVMQSLLILWHTPVTLSALVLHMVAAYVCGTAVYISGVRVMQSLLILWHTPLRYLHSFFIWWRPMYEGRRYILVVWGVRALWSLCSSVLRDRMIGV